MLDLVAKGIASNKEEVFKDFNHTDCDIFGGDVSAGTRPTIWGLVILFFNLWCSIPCKLCWKYIVRAHTAYKINSLKMFLSDLYESETNRYIIFKVTLYIQIHQDLLLISSCTVSVQKHCFLFLYICMLRIGYRLLTISGSSDCPCAKWSPRNPCIPSTFLISKIDF